MDPKGVTLEQDVELELSAIFELPEKDKFRCYEIARLLKAGLDIHGYKDVSVYTGNVRYDRHFLGELWLEKFRKDGDSSLADILKEELDTHKGFTPRILHSWIEVGDTVIDYQNNISASDNDAYQSFLIIERKDKLDSKVFYRANGREVNIFGRPFIYTFTGILPYFTRLRI